MPLSRPTYKALLERYIATIETRLPGADARLPASDLNVSGHVIAEVASGLYDFGLRIADQILPNSADTDQLEIIAADWGIHRKPAVSATGTVTLTRSGTANVVVGAGTVLRCAGRDYVTDAEVTVSAATMEVAITAVSAGAAGNQDAGLSMALASPVAGIAAKGVSGEISGGSDQEEPAALLARLLARMRRPPHGGAADDYEGWALACDGITRAWVYKATPRRGFVTVLVVRDNNLGGPIPTEDEVAAVQAYMDRDDIAPVCSECIVLPPTTVAHDLVIQISPNNSEVRATVEAAIRSWYRAESVPGQLGALSRLSAAISAADGEIKHRIVAPAADAVLSAFEMALVNSITFQDYA